MNAKRKYRKSWELYYGTIFLASTIVNVRYIDAVIDKRSSL